MRYRLWLLSIFLLSIVLTACGGQAEKEKSSNSTTLRIVAGSENRPLEPLIEKFAKHNNMTIEIDYLGSVDISLLLQGGLDNIPYDAVWPAHSLWITYGDQTGITKHQESILRSPVVLGIKKSIAEDLGWVGKDVTVEQILEAAEAQQLRLMMTSATQSNSGASAYFGFLYALSGKSGTGDALTSDDLNNPELSDQISRILGTIDRSSQSSGFLKELFLNNYGNYDGMFNYEALIIELNQGLAQFNRENGTNLEPLYAIYPTDGLTIADSPLAYVDHGNNTQEDAFLKLQEYLLSDATQKELLKLGRRTGKVGLNISNPDTSVFNPDWGLETNRTFVPIVFPTASVIEEALNLYQTAFRKGSFTVYCVDFSGSMAGDGEKQLDTAMRIVLVQHEAKKYLLQASPKDVTIVIPFNHAVIDKFRVDGNDEAKLEDVYEYVLFQKSDGGTDIYNCAIEALNLIAAEVDWDRQFPAIILMTDGMSEEINREPFRKLYIQKELPIPVFSILFGEADESQLTGIAELSSGVVYNGTDDLIAAFRSARGNN